MIKSLGKDNLLIFNVKQGFEPLCKFLEIEDCPTEPFPHANDKFFIKMLGIVLSFFSVTWPIFLLLGIIISLLFIRFIFRICLPKTNNKKKKL